MSLTTALSSFTLGPYGIPEMQVLVKEINIVGNGTLDENKLKTNDNLTCRRCSYSMNVSHKHNANTDTYTNAPIESFKNGVSLKNKLRVFGTSMVLITASKGGFGS